MSFVGLPMGELKFSKRCFLVIAQFAFTRDGRTDGGDKIICRGCLALKNVDRGIRDSRLQNYNIFRIK